MLSLQYLNKRLKKNHVEKILANYNIKYTTMRKEIENKIDIMIKAFTDDISAFYNKMDEIAEQKEQLKTIENNQNELEMLKDQVNDYKHEQNELKREIELLKMENNRLKVSSNNNSTISPKKKLSMSPTSSISKEISKDIKTITCFSPNKRPIFKKPKDGSNLKSEKKETRETKDSRIFKSPQAENLKKRKKIPDLNSNDINNKKIKTILKKKDNKSQRNMQTYATEQTPFVPKSKNVNFNSTKNLTKRKSNVVKGNTIIATFKENKSGKINEKKNENKKNTDMLRKSETSILDKTEKNSFICKRDYEDLVLETETININESKSKITTGDNEDELTIIDEEINEMVFLEDEITSLIGEIKQFKENNDLT